MQASEGSGARVTEEDVCVFFPSFPRRYTLVVDGGIHSLSRATYTMGRRGGADGAVQRHHAAGRAGRFERKRQEAFAALEAAR